LHMYSNNSINWATPRTLKSSVVVTGAVVLIQHAVIKRVDAIAEKASTVLPELQTIFSANADVVDNGGRGLGLSTITSTNYDFLSTLLLCLSKLWNIDQYGRVRSCISGHFRLGISGPFFRPMFNQLVHYTTAANHRSLYSNVTWHHH